MSGSRGSTGKLLKVNPIAMIKTYPYTFDQLRQFKKEIEEAGDFEELMLKKEAIKRIDGQTIICRYQNIESYKIKHVTGLYESLRNNLNSEVPYVFWGKIYELVKRYSGKEI